jgi:LmbE family N-acetylglucosaminyl deacetylase
MSILTRRALLFASDQPDTFVDIEPVIDRKLEALEMHVSQVSAFTGGVRQRMRQRAEEAGKQSGDLNLAESYLVVNLE